MRQFQYGLYRHAVGVFDAQGSVCLHTLVSLVLASQGIEALRIWLQSGQMPLDMPKFIIQTEYAMDDELLTKEKYDKLIKDWEARQKAYKDLADDLNARNVADEKKVSALLEILKKDYYGDDYFSGKSKSLDIFLKRGSDSKADTKLFLMAAVAAQLKLSSGIKLAIHESGGNVEPVIYLENNKTKMWRVLDSQGAPVTGNVYDPVILVNSAIKDVSKQDSPFHDEDFLLIKAPSDSNNKEKQDIADRWKKVLGTDEAFARSGKGKTRGPAAPKKGIDGLVEQGTSALEKWRKTGKIPLNYAQYFIDTEYALYNDDLSQVKLEKIWERWKSNVEKYRKIAQDPDKIDAINAIKDKLLDPAIVSIHHDDGQEAMRKGESASKVPVIGNATAIIGGKNAQKAMPGKDQTAKEAKARIELDGQAFASFFSIIVDEHRQQKNMVYQNSRLQTSKETAGQESKPLPGEEELYRRWNPTVSYHMRKFKNKLMASGIGMMGGYGSKEFAKKILDGELSMVQAIAKWRPKNTWTVMGPDGNLYPSDLLEEVYYQLVFTQMASNDESWFSPTGKAGGMTLTQYLAYLKKQVRLQ